MSSPLCITLTASCRLDASHRPFRLGEKEKKMITSPEFPREPVASAPLPPFWAPPSGMFLNMMNRRGQDAVPRGASPRLLGQPSSLPQASLLHASQPAARSLRLHFLCPNGDITNHREGRVHSLAWQSGEKRWVLQSQEQLLLVGDPRLQLPPLDSFGSAVFLAGMNSAGGCATDMPGAWSLSPRHSQCLAIM